MDTYKIRLLVRAMAASTPFTGGFAQLWSEIENKKEIDELRDLVTQLSHKIDLKPDNILVHPQGQGGIETFAFDQKQNKWKVIFRGHFQFRNPKAIF